MRLIDVKTLELKEFHHKVPPYAILSHTWGDQEVTFQEYLLATNNSSSSHTYIRSRPSDIKRKAGFAKILGACSRASADRLGYLWCDTNCIDKTSSAELSEAINSMYAWYHDSAVCYAYLSDVGDFDRAGRGADEFRKSRWFTRGWTLQELLAPKEVIFFNANWESIANRNSLADIICRATMVHKGALEDRNTISEYSIAQRMSWAADRQTSKLEDIAYCLLGIFGINMSLRYGEGSKAFTRLQEEIIKVSDDQSIFAWDFFGHQQSDLTGVLAPSPGPFASCGSIVWDRSAMRWPYSITNLGISLPVSMIRTRVYGNMLVRLNCSIELHEYRSCRAPQPSKVYYWRFPVWIWLALDGDNTYARSCVPASRTFLSPFYPEGANCIVTELMVTISSTDRLQSRIPRIAPSARSICAATGFHITISFGRIVPQTRQLDEAFPPGNFAVTQLPPRGSPALSHEIISAGTYIVLFSIVWDHQQRKPVHCHHGIFYGLNGITFGQMSANHWDILFRTEPSLSLDKSGDAGQIEYIHDQIRRNSAQPTIVTGPSALPFIHIEKDLRQDQYGRAMVVAQLTFQELTESTYSFPPIALR
ncbi:HET-domain-containing protein [Xylaria bambusicola]|uniref:HET-domain-containing protein n=1 Tax=Xylaria bambusicola TaxID=326684 RepID=UPI002008D390|nr:HET-domain-containing protein [Xylaria bambusicola]KAI0509007.1 HET-domain-containing protein [Xylaria bambusicola]